MLGKTVTRQEVCLRTPDESCHRHNDVSGSRTVFPTRLRPPGAGGGCVLPRIAGSWRETPVGVAFGEGQWWSQVELVKEVAVRSVRVWPSRLTTVSSEVKQRNECDDGLE